MTQQMPPPTPAPQYQPSPSRWGTIGVVTRACWRSRPWRRVVVVLVGDARDDDGDVATTGVTTTVNANATTRSPTTWVLPSTSAAPVGGYGTTPCAPAAGTAAPVRTFSSPLQKCVDAAKK
jgi:hypothetical protein